MTDNKKLTADYALVFELLKQINACDDETSLISKICEMFTIVCSPQILTYIIVQNDLAEIVHSTSSDHQEVLNRLKGFQKEFAWSPSGQGFILSLKYKQELFGILEVDGFNTTDEKNHFFNLFMSIIGQLALAISNVRKVIELKDHKENLENLVDERTKDLQETNTTLSKEVEIRKEAEQKIRNSLKEKEILLREVFHRTKNNMQVINGFITLQSLNLTDPAVKLILNELKNRIYTMSLVHQKLYQSNNLTSVILSDYIEDLAHYLLKSYQAGKKVKLDKQETAINMDTAIPCGLIINELISNTFKHAFNNQSQGKIKIQLQKKGQQEFILTYADNGPGLPFKEIQPDFKYLGMKIISGLIEGQLQGQVELLPPPGARFQLTFKELDYQERIPTNETT